VPDLVLVQPRHGRQDAVRVCGQEHHVVRVAPGSAEDRVRYQVDWIGGPRVLGLLVRVVVGDPRPRVVDDVLEDRPEALRRRVDLGLRLLLDPDRLRVAPAFEVEDAAVAPAVLVIADEMP